MIGKILLNGTPKLLRAPWWVLSCFLLIFNSTAQADCSPLSTFFHVAKARQLGIPPEQLPVQEINDPHHDVHCHARKAVKLNLLKKYIPQTLLQARDGDPAIHPQWPFTAPGDPTRPAYYAFLFRYTPF